LFLARAVDPQTGRPLYSVVDGQQRLRAVFEFLDNRIRLPKPEGTEGRGRRYRDLTKSERDRLLNYDFSIVELYGYTESDIRDIFVRMNKYGVKLSPQELRHARERGAFKRHVEQVGEWSYWKDRRVFTSQQLKRMRQVEFAAELIILLAEGPQDKKTSVDLYYKKYERDFPDAARLSGRLRQFLEWIATAVPNFETSRYRRAIELYSLVGALDRLAGEGQSLKRLSAKNVGTRLSRFAAALRKDPPGRRESRYLTASARQTDNIRPRETRIEILCEVISAD
jgi:hypothetical protein